MLTPPHRRGWIWVALAALVIGGCHLIGDVEDLIIVDDGSGAATGTGSGTATGTGTGAGSGTGTGDGTTSGSGGTAVVCDATDCPVANSECETAACINNVCDYTKIGIGTPCGGSQYCDGQGSCVPCIDNSNWPCAGGQFCQSFTCVSASCDDGAKNNNETDVDCGGSCGACANGFDCVSDGDCLSLVCSGTCQACGQHTDCPVQPAGHYCDPVEQRCQPQKNTLAACSGDNADYECKSWICDWCIFYWCCW